MSRGPAKPRRYRISLARTLSCPPHDAFALVCDVERFPEFMPNVVSVTLLSAEGHRKVAAWNTLIDDAPLDWVEEGIYDDDSLTVRFTALEGVFERFDGFWRVESRDGGSQVVFELTYELGLPEIEEIVGPILRTHLIENVDQMLVALQQRAGGTR